MDPQLLKPFLDDPDRPAGTLRYHELQGFLFTVASAPELVPPSEWLPIIFGEADAGYASLDQAHERSGPRIVDSVLSEISTGFQAAVFTATCSKYTASGVRRSSAV